MVWACFEVRLTLHAPNPNPCDMPGNCEGGAVWSISSSILAAPGNSDSLFVIVTFSGGGTRAAALSYGVLQALRETEITWEGQRRRLDEVDVISSVSGGSFTAAYYALHGDGLFEDFRTVMLTRDIQGDLLKAMFNPLNWVRLASPTYSRLDLAAAYYDTHIFAHKTYGDLVQRNRRPFVILNATDMSLGSRFWFTQGHFDLLCSDLSEVHLARAAAASSAFPVAFPPLTLRNYAPDTCGYPQPPWVALALRDVQLNPARYRYAKDQVAYADASARPFIHLMDGGVADNIGLRGPLHAILSMDSPWSVQRLINRRVVQKLVVIVVDAKVDPPTHRDRKQRPPGVVDVLASAATVPMENYSFDTVELLKRALQERTTAAAAYQGCSQLLADKCSAEMPVGPPPQVDFYRMSLSFDALPDAAERAFFNGVPTTFSLPAETVTRLIEVGGKLLRAATDFEKLLRDLR